MRTRLTLEEMQIISASLQLRLVVSDTLNWDGLGNHINVSSVRELKTIVDMSIKAEKERQESDKKLSQLLDELDAFKGLSKKD